QFGVSFEAPSRRLFGSVTGRYDSGIPFELPDDFDARTFPDPQALALVNLQTGRANPRTIFDAMAGSELYRRGSTRLEMQAGVLTVSDPTYLLTFLSFSTAPPSGAPRGGRGRWRGGFGGRDRRDGQEGQEGQERGKNLFPPRQSRPSSPS